MVRIRMCGGPHDGHDGACERYDIPEELIGSKSLFLQPVFSSPKEDGGIVIKHAVYLREWTDDSSVCFKFLNVYADLECRFIMPDGKSPRQLLAELLSQGVDRSTLGLT